MIKCDNPALKIIEKYTKCDMYKYQHNLKEAHDVEK